MKNQKHTTSLGLSWSIERAGLHHFINEYMPKLPVGLKLIKQMGFVGIFSLHSKHPFTVM